MAADAHIMSWEELQEFKRNNEAEDYKPFHQFAEGFPVPCTFPDSNAGINLFTNPKVVIQDKDGIMHEVIGTVTATVDRDGSICVVAKTKPFQP